MLSTTTTTGYAITPGATPLKSTRPSQALNLRFPGQYADSETGEFYNYFRQYDPKTGRYTQADPIGLEAGWNRFIYVNGSPLSSFDPFGLVDIPDPNGTIPGGPWTPHNANMPGQFLGPKQDSGGRAQCQFVPDEANGGPPGSKGYWKTNQPGEKGWQRFDFNGKSITAAEAHHIPAAKKPSGNSGAGGAGALPLPGGGGGGGGGPGFNRMMNPGRIPYL